VEYTTIVTPELIEADPFSVYARLRREEPVARIPGLRDQWLITRFDDVKQALRDGDAFTTRHSIAPHLFTVGDECVNDCEPETHKRHRAGLAESLSPRAVEARARPYVEDLIAKALDGLAADDHADLVSQYFEWISVRSLTRLLGVPALTTDTISAWFRGLSAGIENEAVGDPDVGAYAEGVSREIDVRLRPYMAEVDGRPDGGALSLLLSHARGDSFEDRFADVMPTAKVLIGAGQQEPGHGGSTVAAGILSDDATRERFVADIDEHVADAVEEGLRWVAPIQLVPRRAVRDVEIEGVTIPAGSMVGVCVGSANRDEDVFGDDADEFRLGRQRHSHLAFSFGDHFCAGNYFGRAVIRLSLAALFRRYPQMRLAVEAVPFKGVAFRSPSSLPVRLGPTGS
jgi:cytochrome P450